MIAPRSVPEVGHEYRQSLLGSVSFPGPEADEPERRILATFGFGVALSAIPGVAAEMRRLKDAYRMRTLSLPLGMDFTSNDYLGFARHPALREAAIAALEEEGMVGAGGSRLLRGHHPAHARLEEFAAGHFGVEKTLFMGSGFVANYALFSTLCQRHDAVIFDERAHASVKEGIHASAASRYRARHNDLDSFEAMVASGDAICFDRAITALAGHCLVQIEPGAQGIPGPHC